MLEAWELYVGAPAELSGEINKWGYAERIVQRRSGIDKWEYADRRTYCTTGAEWSDGEFPGQNRPGHDSVPWTPRPRAQTNEPSARKHGTVPGFLKTSACAQPLLKYMCPCTRGFDYCLYP